MAIIFDKPKRNHTIEILNIYHKDIKAVSKIIVLGTEIRDKIMFNSHINNICKPLSIQLNALIRLNHVSRFEEKKVLVNTFILPNFYHCFLVWNFSSVYPLKKIENLQKRTIFSCWTIMATLVCWKIRWKSLAVQIRI